MRSDCLQFAQDCPDFSIPSPTSQEIPSPLQSCTAGHYRWTRNMVDEAVKALLKSNYKYLMRAMILPL